MQHLLLEAYSSNQPVIRPTDLIKNGGYASVVLRSPELCFVDAHCSLSLYLANWNLRLRPKSCTVVGKAEEVRRGRFI